MKISRSKAAGLLLSVVFLFSFFSVALAKEGLPEGGESFSDAVVLDVGAYEYEEDWLVGWEVRRYYKIEGVKPGQEVTVRFLIDGPQSFIAEVFNSERQNIEWREVGGEFEMNWLAGSEGGSKDYFLAVEASGEEDSDFELTISKKDFHDAGSNTDAGESLSNPLEIREDEVIGYFSGDLGDDDFDVYKKSVSPGKKLNVRITPSMNYTPEVTVYNADREQILWGQASNEGAILDKATDKAVGSRHLYIKVKSGHDGDEIKEYTMKLAEKKVSVADSGDGGATGDGGQPWTDGRPESSNFLKMIFAGGGSGGVVSGILGLFGGLVALFFRLLKILFALIVLGIIVFLVIKFSKKGKKKTEEREVERTEASSLPREEGSEAAREGEV